MRPRKSHKKSRHGCIQCKKRRVKCDEQQPSCRNCTVRESHCDYITGLSPHQHPPTPKIAPETASTASSSLYSFSSPISRPEFPPKTQSHAIWTPELGLIHQYSTQTYKSLTRSEDPTIVHLWQTVIPEESSRHDFLLNSVFTFTSLHLASLHPEKATSYTEYALRYQNFALPKFRGILQNLNQGNCTAALGFGIITMLSAVAMSAISTPESKSAVESILVVHELIRGVGSVVKTCKEWMDIGPFRAVVRKYPIVDVTQLDNDTRAAFRGLRGINDDVVAIESLNDAAVYGKAIDSLETCFVGVSSSLDRGAVLLWLVQVGEEYVFLLRQKKPMAQAILVYFAVLLANAVDHWWSRDSGRRIVRELTTSLRLCGSVWVGPADWALKQIAEAG